MLLNETAYQLITITLSLEKELIFPPNIFWYFFLSFVEKKSCLLLYSLQLRCLVISFCIFKILYNFKKLEYNHPF